MSPHAPPSAPELLKLETTPLVDGTTIIEASAGTGKLSAGVGKTLSLSF